MMYLPTELDIACEKTSSECPLFQATSYLLKLVLRIFNSQVKQHGQDEERRGNRVPISKCHILNRGGRNISLVHLHTNVLNYRKQKLVQCCFVPGVVMEPCRVTSDPGFSSRFLKFSVISPSVKSCLKQQKERRWRKKVLFQDCRLEKLIPLSQFYNPASSKYLARILNVQ